VEDEKKKKLTVHEYYHEKICKCNAVLILRENIGIRVKCKHEKCAAKHAMVNKENFQTVHKIDKIKKKNCLTVNKLLIEILRRGSQESNL
jgi:hypothetical protein